MAKIDEVRNEIQECKSRIEELNRDLWALEKEESAYYIGKEIRGDMDYWDEYYHQLGFITTEKAKQWSGETDDDEFYWGDTVFKVDKETYDKFGHWRDIHNAISALEKCNRIVDVNDTIEDLYTKETEIFESLGLQFQSYQHPGDIVYHW